jgi:hypothetical protein
MVTNWNLVVSEEVTDAVPASMIRNLDVKKKREDSQTNKAHFK